MTSLEQMRQPGNRKKRVGIVVSDKMDKTVVVEVTRSFIHGKYKSIVRSRKKFLAHDQNNECHIGDVVRIEETRPLSKSKHWRVREVVEKAR